MKDSSEGNAPTPRRRGRPTGKTKPSIVPTDIYLKGLEMSRTMALQDIGMSNIARSLGVSGALIHYLIGNLAQLHAGINNQFHRRMCEGWPDATDDWRGDLRAIARHIFSSYTAYPGIAMFWGARARPPVQPRVADHAPYGLRFMDLVYRAFVILDLDPRTTILFTETFMDLLLAHVRSTVLANAPEDRAELLGRFAELDGETYWGLAHVREEFYAHRTPQLLEEGLELLLDAFELRVARSAASA